MTQTQIDALVRFLPAFEAETREFVIRWDGGQVQADGSMTAAYPVYADDVKAFFQYAGQPHWSDYDYAHKPASDWLNDDAFIAQASLDQIKTMLTYMLRSERFCDGCWASFLKRGRVQAVLRRLKALGATDAPGVEK